MIELVYPEHRYVSEDRIMTWAHDAFHNTETTTYAETLEQAIEILEDLGHITVKH